MLGTLFALDAVLYHASARLSESTLSLFRHIKESTNTFDKEHKLHTFSIGLPGSPDLACARQVADFLGTIHHEFTFTVQEGIDALEDLIWHIESWEQVCAHALCRSGCRWQSQRCF